MRVVVGGEEGEKRKVFFSGLEDVDCGDIC